MLIVVPFAFPPCNDPPLPTNVLVGYLHANFIIDIVAQCRLSQLSLQCHTPASWFVG